MRNNTLIGSGGIGLSISCSLASSNSSSISVHSRRSRSVGRLLRRIYTSTGYLVRVMRQCCMRQALGLGIIGCILGSSGIRASRCIFVVWGRLVAVYFSLGGIGVSLCRCRCRPRCRVGVMRAGLVGVYLRHDIGNASPRCRVGVMRAGLVGVYLTLSHRCCIAGRLVYATAPAT